MNNNLNILEFGSGNSTIFLAERVKKVTSLEHSKEWYQKISGKVSANVESILTSPFSAQDYLQPLIEETKFDVIIVDGLFRNECIKASLKHLSEVGIIILDDSERTDYAEGISSLIKNGFRQINFSGIAPGIFFRKCTAIFYKDINCLSI